MVAPRMMASAQEEEELDELVRKEIEAAFAGLEEKFAKGEDEEAIEIIRTQGKTILGNVLEKLEEDGQLLSSQLAGRIEELASKQSTDLLERYEGEIDATRARMDAERINIRSEVERLEALNKELQELQVRPAWLWRGPRSRRTLRRPDALSFPCAELRVRFALNDCSQGGGGLSLNRNKLVGGAAFLVGLTGVGAAINEALKFAFSTGSGDAATLGANLLLGIAGLYIYFTKYK